jgi:uncharacterized protein YqjF (DUF2071 family)
MQQRWHEISFFHWRCEPALLQDRLPAPLAFDIFDGAAWISLTPFLLQGLRPPLVPRCLGLDFPETNLRTYVQGPRGPGVWFFSLDAARLSAVVGARTGYGLPYYRARMEVRITANEVRYISSRNGSANVHIHIEKGDRIFEPSPLDHFLTARFRLYSRLGSRLITAKVEHPPWLLNRARVLHFEEQLRRAANLPPEFPFALCHHSPGVDTRIGPPIPIS